MNAYPSTEGMDRHQARTVGRMMALSVVVHLAVFFIGLAISPLFPPNQASMPVFVELIREPFAELPGQAPAPPSPVLRDGPAGASTRAPASPRPAPEENLAARMWLEKLDVGISKVPEAPVARRGGDPGGIPVRDLSGEGPAKPGDFAPAGMPGGSAAMVKQMEDLEARVRRSGRPGVGFGSESEASMMFGGKGGAAGEAIPPWLRDMIRKRVRDSLPELEAIYSDAIRRNPGLRGRLFVRFRIDPSGKVLRAEPAGGDVRDPAFVDTVLEKIRGWNFEPTGGREVEVLHPFLFTAPS